jgi:thymidylate kinase
LTLIVDLPPSAGFERTKRTRNSGGNRAAGGGQQKLFHDVHTDAMEARPMAFHRRVRDLFLELPSYYPAPVAVVDGAGSVEAVHERVMEALSHAAL